MNESLNGQDPITIVPVILAGGSGSRLWPLSREQYPKQFLRLLGEHSLLQATVRRVQQLGHAVWPIVLGAEAHRFLLAEQLREIEAEATILLEPTARNTAPAAGSAAHYVRQAYGEDALMLLLPADHAVDQTEAFSVAVEAGIAAAQAGHIVTFGVRPSRAETGYGYVRTEGVVEGCAALQVIEFVEKPDGERAEQYRADPDYYWNAGIFLARTADFLSEFGSLEPQMAQRCRAAVDGALEDADFVRLDPIAYADCREDSIDYAIMERTDAAALVPLEAGWDDVGCWSYLDRLPADDAAGNRVQGDVLIEDGANNLVLAKSRLVALAGVKDHIVIETDDAILVAPRDRAQSVKAVVQRLRAGRREESRAHSRVYRPWGFYETIARGDRFQAKRICVKPGQKLSLQMHHHRAEHWVVVRGTALVSCDEREFLLSENESTYIPLGNVHRLENPGKVHLELIEVQSGAYLGEDDIVRFEDVYGRTELSAAAQIVQRPGKSRQAA